MQVENALPARIGEHAPLFSNLEGTDGKHYSLDSFHDKLVLVLVFMSNGCPTAKAHQDELITMQETYGKRGVQLIAINSNNASLSSNDTLPEMAKRAKEKGYNFPYLRDEDQHLARKCGAITTPHVFVFDSNRKLRYKGRIDDSRDPARAINHDLRNGLEDILGNRPVRTPETESFGCSIVW